MSAETMEDMMRLRAALAASDKQTQSFLQPLLQLRGVQELLLTFVRDPSRSFEDWVWDPQVRQTLLHMRDANPQAHVQGQHLDEWYARAMEERLQAQVLQNRDDDTPPEFLEDADKAQNDGKLKFKEKNYYAARNAFVRSIESVLKHQESEYYGKTVPASEWDDEVLRGRYVTLCNNVAICGIKMKELSLINEYATKALGVDEASSKALYAMAKLRLMEHRYKEARDVVATALQFHPDKSQFLNLQKEIEAVERKQAMEQAEISEMRSQQVQRAIASAATAKTVTPPTVTEEEREQQLKDDMQKRVKTTPLPTREDDNFAAARLNVYFMQIKQRMLADIHPCYNADAGEEPLFECIIANGTTGEVLATGVKGISKKVVKNEACKVVIEKLWSDKLAAGTLTPDDLAYLERFESARDSGQPLVTLPVVPQKTDSFPQYPVRVSWLERQLQPLPLLNQLTHRGTIQTRFDIEDVSPNKEVTEFKCTGFLNGEQIATASAISKKKARVEVAKQVLAAAFEKNLLLVYDEPADEENDNGGSKVYDKDEQTLARDSVHLDERLSRLHPN